MYMLRTIRSKQYKMDVKNMNETQRTIKEQCKVSVFWCINSYMVEGTDKLHLISNRGKVRKYVATIKYDAANDLYDLSFCTNKRMFDAKIEKINGVFAEELPEKLNNYFCFS